MAKTRTKKPATNAWKGADTLSVQQFSRQGIEHLFEVARSMKQFVSGDLPGAEARKIEDCCKGKILACVFYEVSTRTNMSFVAAMQRLGGTVLQVNSSSSSVQKGETLSDTLKCLECYSDVLVLRHPSKGSAKEGADALEKPLINAGDGDGEHPTQALLDLYTILDEHEKIDGLEVTLLGDLKYGRTTHSLAKLLSRYKVKLNFVAPEELRMPEDVKAEVAKGEVEVKEYSSFDDVIKTTDVLYVTRIQKERFPSEADYNKVKDAFIIDAKVLENMKEKSIVMHPLPRVNEIAVEVDKDPRAAYFRQMENGMYVRMALIALTLDVL